MPQSIQLYGFAENSTSENVPRTGCCTLFLYGQPPSENSEKLPQKTCSKLPRFLCPSLLLYSLYRSVLYGLYQQKHSSTPKQKSLLGIRTLALLENVPSLLPSFLSQAYSEISQAPSLNVSCTLPNAFFYKSENDIFPPKCLFTFPNPKSKAKI
jgi:hypothetical protein